MANRWSHTQVLAQPALKWSLLPGSRQSNSWPENWPGTSPLIWTTPPPTAALAYTIRCAVIKEFADDIELQKATREGEAERFVMVGIARKVAIMLDKPRS